MRSFMVFAFLISSSFVIAEDNTSMISRVRSMNEVDRSKYYEYKDRLSYKRAYALEARRELNAGKVHKYWTAIRVPINISGYYYPYMQRRSCYNRYYNSGIAPYYEYDYYGSIDSGNIRIYTGR